VLELLGIRELGLVMRMKDSTKKERLIPVPNQMRQIVSIQLAKYALHSDGKQYDALTSAVKSLKALVEDDLMKNSKEDAKKEYVRDLEDFQVFCVWVGKANAWLASVKKNKSYAKANSRSFLGYARAMEDIELFEDAPLRLLYQFLDMTDLKDKSIAHFYLDRVKLEERELEAAEQAVGREILESAEKGAESG